MSKLISALTLFALVGCFQGDVPISDTTSQTARRGQRDMGAAPPFGVASAVGASGTSYALRIRQQGSFASLPDRGELFSYPGRSEGQGALVEGAYAWHRVDVSEEHALRAIGSGHLRVLTPTGQTLDIWYDHHVEHPSGDLSWIGHLEGEPGVRTVLTFGADAVFGKIGQPGKRSLRLTMRDGAAWLVETDPARLATIANTGAHPRRPDALAVPKRRANLDADPPLTQPSLAQAAAAAAAITTIDLIVGYTPGFVSEQGGASAAITRLNNLVAIGNDALAVSQVNARIRLVRAMQVSYTDASTNEDALEQLTGYDTATEDYTPPNAAFNALRAARETYGADLVSLVRAFRDPEQDGCGIAWLIGGGRSGVRPGDGQDYFGYSVVSDGYDGDYYCRQETLIHELAHNMGSQHDREAAKGDDGVLDLDDYGAFSYSFGYKTVTEGNFATIMAYADEGQLEYPVFSNPRIYPPCGAHYCGTVNDDNARSLVQTASIVATFRTTTVRAQNDYNGDGRSDILWRNGARGWNTIWPSANSSAYQRLTDVTGAAWKVVGTGDFNGDGRSDILWRYTTGRNSIWLSGNSATRQPISSVTDWAWAVAGTGDFNGDGRSDILWRNGAKGWNTIWPSANSSAYQRLTDVTGTAWKVVGTGDFNGDGRSDILWRNTTDGRNSIWLSGNSATRQPISSVTDLAWAVAGTGDFNGDGRSDILWRNGAKGWNTIWPSANSSAYQRLTDVTGTAWKVVGTGDFNGDGRSDILWRNTTDGRNLIWLSGNSATQQPISSVTDLAWSVVG